MNKNAESPGMATGANDISIACQESGTLDCYDMYYITPWQGMYSPSVLLLRKMDFLRPGVVKFLFSHAWSS
ncbi:hypothetical protein UWK_00981 [Desulfocapsa sulfexigens DSM 10523]|uniref:Uncharacterized protein n=1 Tax=Desulfocapsa sulfexigens (strain DSM 10523 / SB164P1) TaxID=1167006 RepID=M1PCT7_DESSD|nr:hypothetical protein [Desulfocapsa sulfexigens]AGF77555.1 hypothetical protein UWK_00981 [Desulfocapsa sulfexigens DSM 10523]